MTSGQTVVAIPIDTLSPRSGVRAGAEEVLYLKPRRQHSWCGRSEAEEGREEDQNTGEAGRQRLRGRVPAACDPNRQTAKPGADGCRSDTSAGRKSAVRIPRHAAPGPLDWIAVQDFCEDLHGLHNAGAGAIEVFVPVRKPRFKSKCASIRRRRRTFSKIRGAGRPIVVERFQDRAAFKGRALA